MLYIVFCCIVLYCIVLYRLGCNKIYCVVVLLFCFLFAHVFFKCYVVVFVCRMHCYCCTCVLNNLAFAFHLSFALVAYICSSFYVDYVSCFHVVFLLVLYSCPCVYLFHVCMICS